MPGRQAQQLLTVERFNRHQSAFMISSLQFSMKTRWLNIVALTAAATGAALIVVGNTDRDKTSELLNVSYDPTRELFLDLNRQLIARYEHETGRKLIIKQSHGGSARQARAVID